MNLLLDTHIAIWALDNDERLSDEARILINDPENNIYFSAVSVMEVSIKNRKNPNLMDRNGKEFYDEDFTGAAAFLIGNEGRGLSEAVSEKADRLLRIPMEGKVESLNAGVSAAVVMYEVLRQRRK